MSLRVSRLPNQFGILAFFFLTLLVAACGGGGGGGASGPPQSAPSGLSYPTPVVLNVDAQATPLSPTVTGSVSTNLATYGIDRTTHQLVFSYPFAGRLALSKNGILYIQGTGPIVAINVK